MSTAEAARRRREAMRAGTYEPQERSAHLPWPRCADDGTPLGVDLSRHWHDLQHEVRLVSKHPPAMLSWPDYENEVALAVVRRNQMPSAHDPRRSTLRHYLRLVARNVAANLAASWRPSDPLPDEDALPCPPDDLWREEAARCVQELRAQGRVTEAASQYTLAALSGEDLSRFGSRYVRRGLMESVRGAVGPRYGET